MSIRVYIEQFFNELEIYEDEKKGKKHKETLLGSINKFLDNKTEETAFKVYKSFFEAYWIGIQDEVNPFFRINSNNEKF